VSSFYVENFGCRATQADGAAIEEQFREHGLTRADRPRNARYIVLNTCAVTVSAEQDARAAIRRVRRENPGCEVIVTGCYAQRAPHEVASLPGVSVVVGNSHKNTLAKIALRAQPEKDRSPRAFVPLSTLTNGQQSFEGSIFVSDIFAHTELVAAPVFDSANERTRPNLKVQDGCNNRCSFCIIPSLRGRSRSLKLDEVLHQVNQLVESGYREVVISGINLGRWGRDLESTLAYGQPPAFWEQPQALWGQPPSAVRSSATRPNLEALIRVILDRTHIEKLRISSVEPMDWSESLIRLLAESPRIAKHAHVPMQSGSDAVLRRMHRKYRPWHYRQKIELIRDVMPTAAIGADVMVGFPGESDFEFEETCRMIAELPLTYLHVFTFSARPGTPAATLSNQVPIHLARDRNRILRELATKKKRAFMQQFVGQKIEAITLNVNSEHADGTYTEALTDNYLKIKLVGRLAANQWLRVGVTNIDDGTLVGNPIGELNTPREYETNFCSH
jgi:threonylcarbamoyladenosine tRNA methylthiotransferase MtaB